MNLPWPTFVRGRRGGSAWTGGLRFGWRGYSEHRMLLVAGLSLHCTASRLLHILPLLTRGIASQHSLRTTGFQPCPPLTAVPRWRVGWLGSPSFLAAGVGPHDLTICQIVPISEAVGELRRLRQPIALAPGPHRRHPTSPMPRRRPFSAVSMGAQESIPTRPITGRRSNSTIERRVWFMIVKVGDSLGETFGNFVGRLAATLAVLTPVIPAFHASILVVHPVPPDRDHAAMLTMVKDGSWFRLAHRHPSSMAFYRARSRADTLMQDELRAAVGQCSIYGKGQG